MALKKKPVTGMKDILPKEMEIRNYVMNMIRETYGKFGFTAIETPCVEHIENLSSKQGGENEKLIFKILKRGEKLKLTGYINGQENDPLLIEELKYVRMHSTLGYEELKDQDYSETVLQSILYHHENYDGSGYPSNLSGDSIPLGARILRVCDVYAALISDRPYRKAFDVSSVIELMIDEIKNFDMEVFLAFQRVVHDNK